MPGHEGQFWSVRDLMKSTIDHFQRQGFGEARLTIELLLSHALKCQRIELYTHFDKPLSSDELDIFRRLYRRRLAHEPVQYIVGSANFMGLQFIIDKRVFIPRPETESLVEQVMLKCGERPGEERISVLDIGTGSGNIAVSIAKLVNHSVVTSIDKSAEALEVAQLNAVSHGVADAITFFNVDFLTASEMEIRPPYHILVSNPPYVSGGEWNSLEPEVRDFEPRQAVSDDRDGYDFYRRIAAMAGKLLASDGWVIVEIGYGQAAGVMELFRAHELKDTCVENDLQGIPRVVLARRG